MLVFSSESNLTGYLRSCYVMKFREKYTSYDTLLFLAVKNLNTRGFHCFVIFAIYHSIQIFTTFQNRVVNEKIAPLMIAEPSAPSAIIRRLICLILHFLAMLLAAKTHHRVQEPITSSDWYFGTATAKEISFFLRYTFSKEKNFIETFMHGSQSSELNIARSCGEGGG